MRLERGRTGDDGRALRPDEVDVVVDEASIARRVELAHEQDPGIVAVVAPRSEQGLQRPLVRRGRVGPVGVGGLELHVEVAHSARGAAPSRAGRCGSGLVRPGGYASPKTRHAARWRRVATRILCTLPVSMPLAHAGLALEHPGEVEAHDLAARLGDVVVGHDARDLPTTSAGLGPGSRVRVVLVIGRGRPAASLPVLARRRSPAPSSGRERRLELARRRRAGARVRQSMATPSATSSPSSPLVSSASSSTNRSTTRPRATTSTSSRLSSTRARRAT